jgi:hypothetical protein
MAMEILSLLLPHDAICKQKRNLSMHSIQEQHNHDQHNGHNSRCSERFVMIFRPLGLHALRTFACAQQCNSTKPVRKRPR